MIPITGYINLSSSSAQNWKYHLMGVNFGIESLNSGWIVFVPHLLFMAQKFTGA
jgi:hypothetical protein